MTEVRTKYNYSGPISNLCFDMSYTYEDMLKTTPEQEYLNYLKKNHPEVKASIKKVKVDSGYYLVRTTGVTIKPSIAPVRKREIQGPSLKAERIKTRMLINFLEEQIRVPIEDKTGLDDFYDFDLAFKYEDPQALNTQLAKYGLKLELKRNVEMDMLFVENTYTRNLK